MALTTIQQFEKLLEGKENILITFSQSGAGDAIGSAIALMHFFDALGKKADILSPDFNLPAGYSFLKKVETIKDAPGHLKKFVVTVDINSTGIKELSYDVKDNKLRIFVTPKEGYLKKEHVKTSESDFSYDLIITLGTPDLDSLGTVYTQHTDFFADVPVINVDHKPNNEQYGHLNIVDVTKSSTAEVLFELMNELKQELINKDIATALLTGMIARTHSFTKGNVRPKTLQTASTLVKLGADRADIIKNLYQTKSIATFKLWGLALSHLKYEKELGLVYSTLTEGDFQRAGASHTDLEGIVDELITNSPDAKIILLLHEHTDAKNNRKIMGYMRTTESLHAQKILSGFNSTGDKENAYFEMRGTLKDVEEKVKEKIKHQTR